MLTRLDHIWRANLISFVIMKHIAMVFLAGSVLIMGQTTSTSISGIVLDPSGAAATGAEVTIENVGRGLVRRVITNDAGFYSAPALDPGQVVRDGDASERHWVLQDWPLHRCDLARLQWRVIAGEIEDCR